VDSSALSGFEIFSCSECGYEWTPAGVASVQPAATPTTAPAKESDMDKGKLMRSLGLAPSKRCGRPGIGILKAVLWAIAGAVVAAACVLVFEHYMGARKIVAEKPTDLYIEISKTPEYFREGLSDYIMVRGSVINNSPVVRDVPKIMVRLLNREGRVMQEQEREVEAARLAPGEAAYFSYKILRFSDKIEKVSVDLATDGRVR